MSEIKVGSEWVTEYKDIATVKYVGEHKVFIKWNEDGSEGERFKELFLKNFKPKPTRRNIWLNVYEDYALSYNSKKTADLNMSRAVRYQQEIELIDPREGSE